MISTRGSVTQLYYLVKLQVAGRALLMFPSSHSGNALPARFMYALEHENLVPQLLFPGWSHPLRHIERLRVQTGTEGAETEVSFECLPSVATHAQVLTATEAHLVIPSTVI